MKKINFDTGSTGFMGVVSATIFDGTPEEQLQLAIEEERYEDAAKIQPYVDDKEKYTFDLHRAVKEHVNNNLRWMKEWSESFFWDSYERGKSFSGGTCDGFIQK